MPAFRIPVTTDPHRTIRQTLDGVEYQLDFDYNERSNTWHIGLAQADDTRIADGLKGVVGLPLLRLISDAAAPPGELILVDTSGADLDPGKLDLGDRVVLIYLDGSEVA